MPIFVPPAVFDVVQAVFDLPMVAHMSEQLPRGRGVGIQAGQEVARFPRRLALSVLGLPIDS